VTLPPHLALAQPGSPGWSEQAALGFAKSRTSTSLSTTG